MIKSNEPYNRKPIRITQHYFGTLKFYSISVGRPGLQTNIFSRQGHPYFFPSEMKEGINRAFEELEFLKRWENAD